MNDKTIVYNRRFIGKRKDRIIEISQILEELDLILNEITGVELATLDPIIYWYDDNFYIGREVIGQNSVLYSLDDFVSFDFPAKSARVETLTSLNGDELCKKIRSANVSNIRGVLKSNSDWTLFYFL